MAKPDSAGNVTRHWIVVREYAEHTIYKYGEDGEREYSLPREISLAELDEMLLVAQDLALEVAGWNVFLRNLKLTLGG